MERMSIVNRSHINTFYQSSLNIFLDVIIEEEPETKIFTWRSSLSSAYSVKYFNIKELRKIYDKVGKVFL